MSIIALNHALNEALTHCTSLPTFCCDHPKTIAVRPNRFPSRTPHLMKNKSRVFVGLTCSLTYRLLDQQL